MFKILVCEIKAEIESSNVRLSSNNDVLYAVDVIDRMLAIFESFNCQPIALDNVAVAATQSAPIECQQNIKEVNK